MGFHQNKCIYQGKERQNSENRKSNPGMSDDKAWPSGIRGWGWGFPTLPLTLSADNIVSCSQPLRSSGELAIGCIRVLWGEPSHPCSHCFQDSAPHLLLSEALPHGAPWRQPLPTFTSHCLLSSRAIRCWVHAIPQKCAERRLGDGHYDGVLVPVPARLRDQQ